MQRDFDTVQPGLRGVLRHRSSRRGPRSAWTRCRRRSRSSSRSSPSRNCSASRSAVRAGFSHGHGGIGGTEATAARTQRVRVRVQQSLRRPLVAEFQRALVHRLPVIAIEQRRRERCERLGRSAMRERSSRRHERVDPFDRIRRRRTPQAIASSTARCPSSEPRAVKSSRSRRGSARRGRPRDSRPRSRRPAMPSDAASASSTGRCSPWPMIISFTCEAGAGPRTSAAPLRTRGPWRAFRSPSRPSCRDRKSPASPSGWNCR